MRSLLGANILVGKEGKKQKNSTKKTISAHYICAAENKIRCYDTMVSFYRDISLSLSDKGSLHSLLSENILSLLSESVLPITPGKL